MKQDINKLIEELTKVRPDELSTEGLKLFNKINEIIDKNEELEEENENEFKRGFFTKVAENKANTLKIESQVIPKSLIKETIEELNKQEQELQNSISDEEREEYSDANISFELMDIEIRRSVLQELLERRK